MVLRAEHIEKAERVFKVAFFQRSYFNVFLHRAKHRIIDVAAATVAGAIKVAEYHFFLSGQNFQGGVFQRGGRKDAAAAYNEGFIRTMGEAEVSRQKTE